MPDGSINAGGGNDTIYVGADSNFLDGTVTVNGGTGTDKVNVNDQTAPIGDIYTINSNDGQPALLRWVDLSAIEGLTVKRGDARPSTTPSTSSAPPPACR